MLDQLKQFCNKYQKWKPLNIHIVRIEAYSNNGPVISDTCKCIVESTCKTILEDLGISKEQHKRKIHELTKQTVEKLGCISKSEAIVSGFINAINSLGEFRNEYTETGHGQSVYTILENQGVVTQATIEYITAITEHTALFLIRIFEEEYPQRKESTIQYMDNPDFNEIFDDENDEINIGDYGPYQPSEVLFNIDMIAYKTELNNYKTSNNGNNL